MINISNIKQELHKKYNVNENFYQKYTMGIDSPSIDYEIESIINYLKKINYPKKIDNIYYLMNAKKNIILHYSKKDNKSVTEKYVNEIISEIKPVGGIISPETLFATGFLFFLVLAIKFFGAFSEESGKIMARKLFTGEKQKAFEILQRTEKETNYIEQEYLSFSKKGSDFEIVIDNIKKIKK